MLTTNETPNLARTLARSEKARRLADVIEAKLYAPVAQVAAYDEETRRALAIEAGVHEPSTTTWDTVVAILEDRAANYPVEYVPTGRSTLPCGHAPGSCNGHGDLEWGMA